MLPRVHCADVSPAIAMGLSITWLSGATPMRSPAVREHLDAGADQVALGVLNEGGQPGPIEAAVARQLAGKLLS